MLLEVILRGNGSNFNQRYNLLDFLQGKGIIYDLIAYDPNIEENIRNLYFVCHGNRFLKFKVLFRKNPGISKECLAIFIHSNCTK